MRKFMAKHLIISDLHENITALKSAIEEAQKLGGFTDIWFLGDSIGHHGKNNLDSDDCIACLKLLQKENAMAVRGNWEQWLLRVNKKKEKNEHYGLLKRRHKELQNADMLGFIKSWSVEKRVGNFTLAHGSPYACNNSGEEVMRWETYLHPWMGECISTIFSHKHISTKHLIFGHTHDPGYFHYNGIFAYWVDVDKLHTPISLGNYPENHFAINPGSLTVEGQRGSGTALILEETQELLKLTYFDVHA
jgi:predicted phosphodiesterase